MENVKEKSMLDQWREHESGLLVSRDGEIFVPKSRKYPNGHYTYGTKIGCGYLQVQYKKKVYYVHRLVAEVFIPNPDGKETVDHINMKRDDNRVDNLRWATMNEQMTFDDQDLRLKKSKKVLQLTIDGTLVRVWASTMDCGRNGFSQGNVASCCRGERQTHKGYKWQYRTA